MCNLSWLLVLICAASAHDKASRRDVWGDMERGYVFICTYIFCQNTLQSALKIIQDAAVKREGELPKKMDRKGVGRKTPTHCPPPPAGLN
jgi:hypothetical protein